MEIILMHVIYYIRESNYHPFEFQRIAVKEEKRNC